MKDWIAYIRENVDSDLWGYILLDYYFHTKTNYQGTPSRFIDEVLDKLPKEHLDVVSFHKTLLSTCVQLLGIDFSEIMEKSAKFIHSLSSIPSDEQLRSIIAHYEVYGKQDIFRDRLAESEILGADKTPVERFLPPHKQRRYPAESKKHFLRNCRHCW